MKFLINSKTLQSAILMVFLSCQFNIAIAADAIGTIKLVLGSATGTDADGASVDLKVGSPVYPGGAISTGSRSFVRAEMLDGTRFTLGKNATASVDDFAYDEARKVGKFAATVLQGGFAYKSGKIGRINPRARHSLINTPSASIGIRGSELEGEVSPSGRTLVVLTSGVASIMGTRSTTEVTLNTAGNTSEIDVAADPVFTAQPTQQQQDSLSSSLPTQQQIDTATVIAAEEEAAAEEESEEEADEEEADEEEAEEDADEEGDEESDDEGDDSDTDADDAQDDAEVGEEAGDEDAGGAASTADQDETNILAASAEVQEELKDFEEELLEAGFTQEEADQQISEANRILNDTVEDVVEAGGDLDDAIDAIDEVISSPSGDAPQG